MTSVLDVDLRTPARAAAGRAAEEQRVWRALLSSALEARTPDRRPPAYRGRLRRLVGTDDRIPELNAINAWLRPTAWRARYVDGYVPGHVYQDMLRHRVFPVARDFRRLRDLEHSAAPDFAHDVLGHLPMLFDRGYSRLLQAWGGRAVTAKPERADRLLSDATGALISAKERDHVDLREVGACTAALRSAQARAMATSSRAFRFETFFTWAIEFGILQDARSALRIIGGACLSSPGEMRRLTAGTIELRPFAGHAVGHPVDYTSYQPIMFVAQDYDELLAVLNSI